MRNETFGGDDSLSPFVWVLRSAGVAGRHKHAVDYSMPEAMHDRARLGGFAVIAGCEHSHVVCFDIIDCVCVDICTD
jgi:hypothetical protein